MSNTKTHNFWVTCPQGVHGLLKQEISDIANVKTADWNKGVQFTGTLVDAYRVCLWSRLANRVFLGLKESSDVSVGSLQALVEAVNWDEHVSPTGSLKVSFGGRLPEIRDSRYGAQKIKDWVVDQFRERHGTRPDVSSDPDLTVYVQVAKRKMFVGIELTGDSLHRRGYREATGPAPIKENLAAAMLLSSRWPELAKEKKAFLDLMCGAGTLVIEAAMIAADCAPGLNRTEFAFERWLQHSAVDWQELQSEARIRLEEGIAEMSPVLGYDADAGVVAEANDTLQRLGLDKYARCYQKSLADWTLPTHWDLKPGLWVSNPPYGERLGDKPTLMRFYREIGQLATTTLAEWNVGILTSEDILAREIGMRPTQKRSFYNGPIEVTYYIYERNEQKTPDVEVQVNASEQTISFINRIIKNRKQLSKWINKESIEAYRVYDADIPEFSLAVDCYGDWLHVQEYAPPKEIPEQKSQQRLLNAVDALATIYEIPVEQVVIKKRERQKGSNQYEKKAQSGQKLIINEGGTKLIVNLLDYLDSGLFLDHRNSRKYVQENAKNKKILNLFCYTGSFTSHAYVGGASQTTSVDLSKTYLNWAKDNLELNGGKEGVKHQFIHADCMAWLTSAKEQFDIIIMDPPTFSNSARMTDTLDVQRDHEFLIKNAMEILNPNGVLIFSNNFKRFHMADVMYEHYDVKDISNRSIPQDFKRSKPHRCFEIRHSI